MSQKRFIRVTDDKDKLLYQGEDKRVYNSDYPKCALGIPISDWMKTGSLVVGFIVLFTTMRIDINEVKTTCGKFEAYIENHDDWDSAYFHVRFKNGEPLDKRFAGDST